MTAVRLKNQAQAYPGRGVGVRRLDHVNYLGVEVTANRDYLRDTLGALVTEQIVLDDGTIAGSWTTFTNKGYDAVYTRDRTGTPGRLHHIAFAADSRADIIRAADIALDHGVFIETGPHKHAIQQTFFLYLYEPGGNRIELCNPVARLVLAPDWRTITWTEAERARGQAWGLKTRSAEGRRSRRGDDREDRALVVGGPGSQRIVPRQDIVPNKAVWTGWRARQQARSGKEINFAHRAVTVRSVSRDRDRSRRRVA